MTEQERTHEIFNEPPEARMAFVEKLIESVMDEEVDARMQEAWKRNLDREWSEERRRVDRPAWTQERSDDIYEQLLQGELGTRRFRIHRSTRLDVARELIDSLDELGEPERKALRSMCTEAMFRHFRRERFTLG